jgi:hypothetical protein
LKIKIRKCHYTPIRSKYKPLAIPNAGEDAEGQELLVECKMV